MDVQADLSLRWVHMPTFTFSWTPDHLPFFPFSGTFKTDGILRTGTQCTYYFQSYNNQTKGNFYSPRYPQKYLKDLNCQYIFLGHPHEIVRVKFKNIQLHYSGTR